MTRHLNASAHSGLARLGVATCKLTHTPFVTLRAGRLGRGR